ncbi:hypothetical protein AOLI_G00017850 [Acnodon oligacanthus]
MEVRKRSRTQVAGATMVTLTDLGRLLPTPHPSACNHHSLSPLQRPCPSAAGPNGGYPAQPKAALWPPSAPLIQPEQDFTLTLDSCLLILGEMLMRLGTERPCHGQLLVIKTNSRFFAGGDFCGLQSGLYLASPTSFSRKRSAVSQHPVYCSTSVEPETGLDASHKAHIKSCSKNNVS